MRAIRSILWIGPYEGLVQNGLMQAEHLDVVWVGDVGAALELPVASFEAAVLALDELHQQVDAVSRCVTHRGMPPLVILSAAAHADSLRQCLPLGGGEILVAETLSDGPPVIAELHNRIERVALERSLATSSGRARPFVRRSHSQNVQREAQRRCCFTARPGRARRSLPKRFIR